jgi:hypothetical protein
MANVEGENLVAEQATVPQKRRKWQRKPNNPNDLIQVITLFKELSKPKRKTALSLMSLLFDE